MRRFSGRGASQLCSIAGQSRALCYDTVMFSVCSCCPSLVSGLPNPLHRFSGTGASQLRSISGEAARMSVGSRDSRKLIADIKTEQLGMGDRPDWITVRGTVWFIRPDRPCVYQVRDSFKCTCELPRRVRKDVPQESVVQKV